MSCSLGTATTLIFVMLYFMEFNNCLIKYRVTNTVREGVVGWVTATVCVSVGRWVTATVCVGVCEWVTN